VTGRGWRAGAVATAGLLVLAGGTSSCTVAPSPDREEDRPATPLVVSLSSGAASLDPASRVRLETEIGDVLSAYVVEAFLGEYPREDFVGSLESFTGGAARLAVAHLDQLTAARFADAERVVARRLVARISALTDGDKAVAASARVAFRFRVAESARPPVTVNLRGRFMLADQGGEWVVFGYDVVRDDTGAAVAGAS